MGDSKCLVHNTGMSKESEFIFHTKTTLILNLYWKSMEVGHPWAKTMPKYGEEKHHRSSVEGNITCHELQISTCIRTHLYYKGIID